ncbi:HAD family hydrolase [Bacillus carboniphilus]|uniref:HAD family hydrolase n=1 Tax=Bacillus carboniphilus TaxID=86663 RepID=A0ABP3GGL5_9BACI
MLFFDIDGTLLDYKLAESTAVQLFYKQNQREFTIDEKEFVQQWNILSKEYYQRYLDGEFSFQDQQVARMQELYLLGGNSIGKDEATELFRLYLAYFQSSWVPFDDVMPCLTKLRGKMLGIITNGDPDQQRMKLEKLGILHFFQVIVASGEVGVAKPDPGIFYSACEKMGKEPEECVYIGDDLKVDVLGSMNTGMRAIWLNRNGASSDNRQILEINSLGDIQNL